MSESRFNSGYGSSESRGYSSESRTSKSYSSESRTSRSCSSESRTSNNYIRNNLNNTLQNKKDTIDDLIEKYRTGKISGNDLANEIEEINRD